ncbi:MAG: AMP-binding protein [Proteobacteria bacterium]|nr:AMP-binding protein [Pseudomonadota bacterium]
MAVAFLNRLPDLGERPALVFANGVEITYAGLAARIEERRAELGSGRRLIFWAAEPTPDAIVTYLAALQAGHPILPLPPCDAGNSARLAELAACYRPDIHAAGGALDLKPAPAAANDCHPDLSLLLSTSGSTGAAKLVRLSRRNVESNAAAIAEYLALTPQDRSALILPLHYSYGLSVLHAHLAAGASLYFPGGSILSPGFIARIHAAGCTNLSGVPHSFELLEQIGFRDACLPALRFMTVAGGRLSAEMVRRYALHMKSQGGEFFVMYGQTEATARMAYLPPGDALAHADCIGGAIPGGAFRLVDEDGIEIAETGVMGELVYCGPNVMMGYAQSRADLAGGAECAELATGDFALRDPSGHFRLVGRRQRFSKIAGLRIAHDAVEADLQRVGLAATVTGDDRHILIAVTAAADIEPALARTRQLTRLPASCLKALVVLHLPRGSSGKIDYRALAALFVDAATTPPPRSPVGAAFAEIFAPRHIEDVDSFASLGGDSLSFVELSLALKPHIDPLPRGWEHWSVGDLAALAAQVQPQRARRFVLPLGSIDTDLALRGSAILLVVLHHATMWPMAGGAAVLLMLVGYNLARHHGRRLFAGDVMGMLQPCLRPVILYYPLLLALCLVLGDFPWQSLLLVGNLGLDGYSTEGSPLITFWFVEAYAQILVLTAALFTWGRLRRAALRRPFATGLLGLALAVASRPLADHFLDLGEMRYFFTPRILYVPLLGWCLYFADTPQRKAIMSVVVPAVVIGLMAGEGTLGFTIVWVRALLLLLGAALLLWSTRLYLPSVLAKPLTVFAAASFSIYLFHTLPYFAWLSDFDLPTRWRAPIYIALGLSAGLAAHAVLQRVEPLCRAVLGAGLPRWRDFLRQGTALRSVRRKKIVQYASVRARQP